MGCCTLYSTAYLLSHVLRGTCSENGLCSEFQRMDTIIRARFLLFCQIEIVDESCMLGIVKIGSFREILRGDRLTNTLCVHIGNGKYNVGK